MGAALKAEFRKVITTRMWWVLLLAMAVYMAFIAAVVAWALTQDTGGGIPAGSADDVVRAVYTVAVSNGFVFPLIIGAIVVTSEFRHKTLTPTLLADPSRDRLVVAKLGAGAVIGLLYGAVGVAAGTTAGATVLALLHHATLLGSGETWRTLALGVVALACWTLIGVAVGTLLTNQVAAVVVLIAFAQFVEPLLRLALSRTSWGAGISKFMPGAAGQAITGSSVVSDGGEQLLGHWWAGLLVMLGYAAVLAAIGRFTTLRRDVA